MAKSIAVVYAVGSRTIRRVVVTDQPDAASIASPVTGEAVIAVPVAEYPALAAYVATVIGSPTHNTRCVELDATGTVVAVYAADPAIDQPTRDSRNTIELNMEAVPGDQKVAGAFLRDVDVITPEIQQAVAAHNAKVDQSGIATV